jgi:hypothetical protein
MPFVIIMGCARYICWSGLSVLIKHHGPLVSEWILIEPGPIILYLQGYGIVTPLPFAIWIRTGSSMDKESNPLSKPTLRGPQTEGPFSFLCL